MMKILFVNNFDENQLVGGVEHYLLQLTTFLKINKKDIQYIWYGKSNLKTKVRQKIFNKEITVEINQIIDDFKPDIIHCFSIGAAVTPHFMTHAKQLNIPIIFSFRDYYYTNIKSSAFGVKSVFIYLKKSIHKKIINQSISYYITPNHHLTKEISKSFKAEGFTLANPLLVENKNEISQLNEKDFILYVGRLMPEKGLMTLLKAFKKVLEIHPNEKLFIIGNGQYKNTILMFLKQNNLVSKVLLIDQLNKNDLVDYYKNCKFSILPSEINESFGNVILESFYFNKTMICSDLVGLVEDIVEKKLGLIFKNGSVKNLSETILNLLENDNLRKDLEKNASNYVKNFSFSNHVNELINLYKIQIKNKNSTI